MPLDRGRTALVLDEALVLPEPQDQQLVVFDVSISSGARLERLAVAILRVDA